MRVSKVDTGVILEEGELRDDGEDAEMQIDAPSSDSSVAAQQKAMKSLFGDDDKEICEESEIIPTLEPLPPNEVGKSFSPLSDNYYWFRIWILYSKIIDLPLRVGTPLLLLLYRPMFTTVTSEKILNLKKTKDLYHFVDCYTVAAYWQSFCFL